MQLRETYQESSAVLPTLNPAVAGDGHTPQVLLLIDAEQFDLKDERAVRRDGGRGTMLAVREVRRDLELEFITHMHELQSFGPARDDGVQRKTDRLATLHRAVENGAIQQHTSVMHFHVVRGYRRDGAGAAC